MTTDERDRELVRRLLELPGGPEWGDAFEELATLRGVRRLNGSGTPTVGEIAREVGVSPSTAYRRLREARERA